MTNVNVAAAAYQNTLKTLQPGETGPDAVTGPSFVDMLKDKLESGIAAQHAGEKTSASAMAGNASMTDVMAALDKADVALNTVLAVRDRVVQAYDTIMRTQI